MSLDHFFEMHSKVIETASFANRWSISRRTNDAAIVDFEVRAADDELYFVTLLCDNYPTLAPSVKFRDIEGNVAEPTAWPKGTAAFFEVVKPPPNSFLCMPLTREGIQHHGDWVTNGAIDSWTSGKHTLLDIFNYIHRLLNSIEYRGRGPQ